MTEANTPDTTGATPTPPPPAAPKKSGGGGKSAIYIVLILALLGLNGFFFWQHTEANKEKDELKEAKAQLEEDVNKAQAEIEKKIAEIDDLANDTTELSEELIGVRSRLDSMRQQYDKVLEDQKWTVNQLNKKSAELKRLNSKVSSLNEEVDRYKKELEETQALLAEEKEKTEVQAQKIEEQESELLLLGNKVEIGSLLKPDDVAVKGIKIKGNGKESETNSAKKANKIEICFNVPDNQVAEAGNKEILVQLVDPSGKVLAFTAEGSDIFSDKAGKQQQFTKKVAFSYSNKEQNQCTSWSQESTIVSGEYTIRFYQDGYPVGTYKFSLN